MSKSWADLPMNRVGELLQKIEEASFAVNRSLRHPTDTSMQDLYRATEAARNAGMPERLIKVGGAQGSQTRQARSDPQPRAPGRTPAHRSLPVSEPTRLIGGDVLMHWHCDWCRAHRPSQRRVEYPAKVLHCLDCGRPRDEHGEGERQ
jgi:hypothetical protein